MKVYLVASNCNLCYDNIRFEKVFESYKDAKAFKCDHKVIIELKLVKRNNGR